MQNNYHDLTIRAEIVDTVNFYNSPEVIERQKLIGDDTFYGKTVDEAIEMWEATAKATEDIEKTLYLYAENADLLYDDNDIKLVQILLTHPERHRLRLIGDGSYRTHRIWSHVTYDGKIKLSPSICWMNSEFKRMSNQLCEMYPEEQVDFLFKNFEFVYIQIPVHGSREEMERWIAWDRIEYDSWDDYEDIYGEE